MLLSTVETRWYTAWEVHGRAFVRASILYRIASVLMVLFAVGHTLAFREDDPKWGADSVLRAMQSVHFNVQGFERTYWDFFTAFGFFTSVFLLLTAVLAWQLGSLPPTTLASLRATTWALALCFLGITILTWRYVFVVPLVFSVVITLILIPAAWISSRPKTERATA
jgi:hypothetical protein